MWLQTLALTALLLPAPDVDATLRLYRAEKVEQRRLGLLEELAEYATRADEMLSDADRLRVELQLAKATGDPAIDVRIRACRLLHRCQPSDASVYDAIFRASRGFSKRIERYQTEFQDRVEVARTSGDAVDQMASSVKLLRELQDANKRVEAEQAVVVSLLAGLDDDRSVEALLGVRLGFAFTSRCNPNYDALLGFGTQHSVEAAIGVLREVESELKRRGSQRGKVVRQRPVKKPKFWQGSKDAWKEKEEDRIRAQVRGFDEVTQQVEAWSTEHAARLRKFALKRRLQGAPSTARHATWKSWWGKSRASLPKSFTALAKAREKAAKPSDG